MRDEHSGELYASYRVQPGEQVGLGFIHSVNLYPLLDVFQVGEDGVLYAETPSTISSARASRQN